MCVKNLFKVALYNTFYSAAVPQAAYCSCSSAFLSRDRWMYSL